MASIYKKTKTELIAIYRLEFYKNKEAWKLCPDVKKDAESLPPANKNKNLNETYNVDGDWDADNVEQVTPHNKAFLHVEPADGPDIQGPEYEIPSPHTPEHHIRPHAWYPRVPWSDELPGIWEVAHHDWCGAEAEGTPEELAYDDCDGPYPHNVWNTVKRYDHMKPECDPVRREVDLSPHELQPEEWQTQEPSGEECADCYDQCGLLEDSINFLRGAHYAPHSSEADPNEIHNECLCVYSRPHELSSRQLALEVQRHHAILTRLLKEQEIRDKMYTKPSPPSLSFEEFPTRDTDPFRPEVVLGSSHWADSGRGRGRLPRNDRVIGIQMGRPYRL